MAVKTTFDEPVSSQREYTRLLLSFTKEIQVSVNELLIPNLKSSSSMDEYLRHSSDTFKCDQECISYVSGAQQKSSQREQLSTTQGCTVMQGYSYVDEFSGHNHTHYPHHHHRCCF